MKIREQSMHDWMKKMNFPTKINPQNNAYLWEKVSDVTCTYLTLS